MIHKMLIEDFENAEGGVQNIVLYYQIFGQPLHKAPVVLLNHALTGNSEVCGENGWWKEIVGSGKSIDTERFSILAFNIPGNGFAEKDENLLHNYSEFTLRDIAKLQARALESLGIENVFAIIGGSIGGALAWELAVLKPDLAENIIPIASDFKTTDWVLAHCKVQEHILKNSATPVFDARMHAITFYRNPQSFSHKFHRAKNHLSSGFQVQSWLSHHGKKLENRFHLAAYKLMNHLLTTIDISQGNGKFIEAASKIQGNIHFIPIDSDLFFLAEENWDAYVNLSLIKKNVSIHEIKSIHGHDGFLIETRQLSRILKPLFNPKIKNMKTINLVLFGVGNVGSTFIKQILAGKKHFHDQGLAINIPVIANSKFVFFEKNGIHSSWETDFASFKIPYTLEDILNYVKRKNYKNLIAVDATASIGFVENYEQLVENNFHIVAANKVANSLSTEFYQKLRQTLKKNNKEFLYETNVGAGLPIVQTLQGLHQAGEKITKVRGVFSGSLSYIFNTFSAEEKTFAEVLDEAQHKGFTEPDPRIDLSGKDVGRKLLILARELNIHKEFDEIEIEDLVPAQLNGKSSVAYFRKNQSRLNTGFSELKQSLAPDEVLRHVGELDISKNELKVKLVKEKKTSAFGGLKNADSSFEIYTESYGEQPLVIQGAGAGAAVTARGILSDLIKLAKNIPDENQIKTAQQQLSFRNQK